MHLYLHIPFCHRICPYCSFYKHTPGKTDLGAFVEAILDEAGIDQSIKVKDWNDDQIAKVREVVNEKYKVEGALRSETQMNIKRLMDIGSYRGIRHRIGLPTRGQSTKNNARTRKGRKKTVANKKKAVK